MRKLIVLGGFALFALVGVLACVADNEPSSSDRTPTSQPNSSTNHTLTFPSAPSSDYYRPRRGDLP